jgi:diaminohydroxyphosphoribosylaminopyrimidine deaminase/5-amino-6-(5-phosphoribosylamino)uracil reductase
MMRRALDLARRGAGSVSPNPMVGAVIVDADRRTLGEGWHERFGGPHAEVNAFRAAAGSDLTGATMYATLEPCSHFGKTPPCVDAVIEARLGRVVVAMRDPNPMVSGRSIRKMREAGIEVVVGTLEKEARRLGEAYIHFITTGTPFVLIKMAQTLDGYTALPSGESRWITGEPARRRVHEIRAVYDAVMVGTRTAQIDDPSLTLRYGVEGRNPHRVVLDRNLTLPGSLRLFSDEQPELTIVFTADAMADSARAAELRDAGARVFGVSPTPRGLKLPEMLRILGENNIASVMVEGGAGLAGALIAERLAQKLILFLAPKLFGRGISAFSGLEVERIADAYSFDIQETEMVGGDVMMTAYWHRA